MPRCLTGNDSISVLFVWKQSMLSQFLRKLTEFIASVLNKEVRLTFWLSSRGMRVRHLLFVVRVPWLSRQHDCSWSWVLQVELVMAKHQALMAVLPTLPPSLFQGAVALPHLLSTILLEKGALGHWGMWGCKDSWLPKRLGTQHDSKMSALSELYSERSVRCYLPQTSKFLGLLSGAKQLLGVIAMLSQDRVCLLLVTTFWLVLWPSLSPGELSVQYSD